MKRIATALGLLLLLHSGSAGAQPTPRSLLVSFSSAPAGPSDQIKNGVVAFLAFDFYVVAYAGYNGMEAYELSVSVPPGMIVTNGRTLPDGATDFGVGEDNFIVGTGGICYGATDWFALVRYAGAAFLASPPANTLICPAGAIPSSFPNGQPGYLPCLVGELTTFTLPQDLPAGPGCAILNFSGVPVQSASFGALKSRF